MAAGCKAQPTPQSINDQAISRHIEVVVRSQFGVPQDVNISIGARKPSQFAGYDALPITLSKGASSKTIDFLISTDGKTLAKLETFDVARDPMSAIDVTGRPIRGNPAAKVTIVNYDDLECPYCARMHQTLFPGVLERYKDLVRVIYKDDPLAEIHPWAVHASVDANCLAAQSSDVYWTYIDYIHAHGDEVSGADRNAAKSFDALNRIARQEATLAKLDMGKLEGCLSSQDDAKVRASAREAEGLGIDGTPALFVDGERIPGVIPEQQLWTVIDRALRAQGVEPPAAKPQTAKTVPAGGGK